MKSVISIAKHGPELQGTARDLAGLRAEYGRQHAITIPGFLKPGLLRQLQRSIHDEDFVSRIHRGIGKELYLKRACAHTLLTFLNNDPRVFDVVRQLTGCSPIGCFIGRIYRFGATGDHYLSWHDDLDKRLPRLVAMSINLSKGVYEGGVLQIRSKRSKRIVYEGANTGFGDAVLFRVDPELQHRVTDISGSIPRTSFAGWFQARPVFASGLNRGRTYRDAGSQRAVRTPFTLRDVVRIPASVVSRTLDDRDGRVVVCNLETERCFSLDSVSGRAWRALARPTDLKDICRRLRAEYAVPAKELERDVLKLAQQLHANGLIEKAG